MIFEKLSETAIQLIVTKMIEKILSSNWKPDKEKAKDIFIQFSEHEVCKNYTEKYVTRFLKMRTLHSAESDVFLDEVYTPLTLESKNKNTHKIKIDEKYSLPPQKSINIIGIAGQGKSTILRKIFIEEMNRGQYFPFFIELRRIQKDEGILVHLENTLINLGIKINEKSLSDFLNSRKVLILLDGYDEVRSEKRLEILNEIINIESKYDTRIISTTRPDTEICSEVDRVNFHVKKLSKNEILDILEKLDKRNESPELKQVITKNALLSEILVTPILVNLFAVCYPYLDVIPNDPVDFYDKIFLTLYSRHDKIKNFSREKYSKVNSSKAQEIFSTLSYISLVGGNIEFCEESLNQDLNISLNLNYIDSTELENIKNDIINITCLIQPDGFDRYVFLHKSIQEFHAAKFIATLDSENKRNIYDDISKSIINDDSFDNVISFLKNIDKKDFHTMLTEKFAEDQNLKQISAPEIRKRANEIAYEIIKEKEFGIDVSQEEMKKNYEFAFVEGVTVRSLLAATSLLKTGARHDAKKIENYILASTFGKNDELNDPDKKYINFFEDPKNRKLSKHEAMTESNIPQEDHNAYNIYDYFKELGYYNDFENLVFKLVKEFHFELLKPEIDRKSNIADILASRTLRKNNSD